MKFSQRGGSLKGNGKGLLAGRETPKTPFRSLSNACHAGYVKYAFSRRSSAVTVKKCTKKVCCACKVVDLLTVNVLLSPGGLFILYSFERGWDLLETGGLFERECSFNLETTVVSVLHKELEYKVEDLKSRSWTSCSRGSKTNPNFQLVNKHPVSVHMKFYSCDWFIQSIIC